MSVTEQPPSVAVPNRRLLRRVVRAGFPQVVIVLATVLYFATTIRAGHHIERQWFSMFRMCVILLAAVLLAIWMIFFTGWPRLKTFISLTLIAGMAWGLFRIDFDGDLKAAVHGRDWVLKLFGISHEDEVMAHRKLQGEIAQKRAVDLTLQPGDWPSYRGEDRAGVSQGPPLSRDWNKKPPRVVWKQPTYGGFSSFAVINGFLFTMEQRPDGEAVVCYDARDGTEIWAHTWPGKFVETLGGPGPRATPTVDGGDVFAIGALGRLVCLDGKDGSLKWAVETLQGKKNLNWGMSGSPLVYGNMVVVNPGTQGASQAENGLVAFDRRDGHVLWSGNRYQAGYASPMLARLGGRQQILLFDGIGLGGYDPQNGAELWHTSWKTQGSDGINVAQPVVLESAFPLPIGLGAICGMMPVPLISRKGEVFIASAYGRGGALLRIEERGSEWTATEVWRTSRTSMRCKVSSPIEFGDYLYGLDDGNLECIDLADGSRKWKDERAAGEGEAYGQGQILRCGDLLVVLTHYGEIALVEAAPNKFNELGRMKVLAGEKTWNNPALVQGMLYIRNHLEMACVDLRE